MRKCILAATVSIAVGVFGLSGTAEASAVHVRCKTSALVSAVNAANSNPGTVLTLARGCVYRLRAPADLGYGLPLFTSTTTIRGNGATVVRKSGQQFAIIGVLGANLTMSSLTIEGGHAPDGVIAGSGGGIFNTGTLTLDHVTVRHNRAGTSTSIFAGGSGGGIFNGGILRLVRSKVIGNRAGTGMTPAGAGGVGGGIDDAGTLEMTRTTVAHNRSGTPGTGGVGGSGGGLYEVGFVPPTISHSIFTANKAVSGGQGGGIYNGSVAPMTPSRTKIVRNRPNNCAGFGPVANCHH